MNPRKILTLFFTILSIVGYGLIAFSAGPFAPGTELDPGCSPYINNDPNQGVDTDCVVEQLIATTATSYTWVGSNAGQNGGSTDNTVFIGIGAGDGATNADNSNFIGTGAGENATNAYNSNFFGPNAGCNAINANDSNFFGFEAGCFAINADNSNFFGNRAGYYAADAQRSTFFGDKSGYEAANAEQSNFTGYEAGYQATNAYNANFSGYQAGYQATDAAGSNFIGYRSGYQAADALGSNFLGSGSGANAINANNSNFLGAGAGGDATDAEYSNFLGGDAGRQAYSAANSNFLGFEAGYNSANTADFLGASTNPFGLIGSSNFFGTQAGLDASGAVGSTFIGAQAGAGATGAYASNFFGLAAGTSATGAFASGFYGNQAGYQATNARNANFIGNRAGYLASAAARSVFIGGSAGRESTSSSNSVFIGSSAGQSATTARNAIFIGSGTGYEDTVVNASTVVNYTLTSGGPFQVDENIVGSLSGTTHSIYSNDGTNLVMNTASGNFTPGETITGLESGAVGTVNSVTQGQISILIGNGSGTGGYSNSIALGGAAINTASNQFMIGSQDFPINELVVSGNGASCTIDNNIYGNGSTGLNCSSDERLKTNITDLDNSTLEKVTSLRAVTYNWNANPNSNTQIGFLAQDLQSYFPELVREGHDGYLQVNYAGMTPILTKAIQELDMKIDTIETIANSMNATLFDELIAWFGSKTNGISKLFVRELCVTDGTDEECLSLDQVRAIKNSLYENSNNETDGGSYPETDLGEEVIPDPIPEIEPVPENDTDEAVPVISDEPTSPGPDSAPSEPVDSGESS